MLVFPVSLDLANRPVLLVGAGKIALRKAGQLLDAGATIVVIAPEVHPGFEALPVSIQRRVFAAGDTAGFRLIVTATGNSVVDQQIFDEAEASGIWVNSADDPARCSFILPAIHRQGPISIAVSTGGASPAMASWLRAEIASLVGPEFAELVDELSGERAEIKATGASTEDIDWRPIIEAKLRERGLSPFGKREGTSQ